MTVQFIKTEVIPHGMAPSSESDALKIIEICGRTAYKSEDKITADSAKAFVLMLKKHGHLSVLEHSNAVLRVQAAGKFSAQSMSTFGQTFVSILKERNAYHRSQALSHDDATLAISANFRGWLETLEYLKERQSDHYLLFGQALKRFYPNLFQVEDPFASSGKHSSPDSSFEISLLPVEDQLAALRNDPSSDLPVFIFKIICDRGITHEIVRHRVFSFTQESTRYVNYKNKGMVLILPEELEPFYDLQKSELSKHDPLVQTWLSRAADIFKWYQEDIGRGRRPEIARDILPNLLKSEIFASGRWSGWKHFILLRDSKQAHPRIRMIARKIREYFESLGMYAA